MIELSTLNAQTLPAGQSVSFDNVLLHTGCAEYFKENGPVFLTQKNAIYWVNFNSNIGGVAEGDVQISITLNGGVLPETTAKTVTAVAGDLTSVSGNTFIKVPCVNNLTFSVLLTNTGTAELNIDANTRLSIKRIA